MTLDPDHAYNGEKAVDWKAVSFYRTITQKDGVIRSIINYTIANCLKNGVRFTSDAVGRDQFLDPLSHDSVVIEQMCFDAVLYFICLGVVPITVARQHNGYMPIIPPFETGFVSVYIKNGYVSNYRWWDFVKDQAETNLFNTGASSKPNRKVVIIEHPLYRPRVNGVLQSILNACVSNSNRIENSRSAVDQVELHEMAPTILLKDMTKPPEVPAELRYGIFADSQVDETIETSRFARSTHVMEQIMKRREEVAVDVEEKVKLSLRQTDINNTRPIVNPFSTGVDFQDSVAKVNLASALSKHSTANSLFELPNQLEVTPVAPPRVTTDPIRWREVLYEEISILFGVPIEIFRDPRRGGSAVAGFRVTQIAHETISRWKIILSRVITVGYQMAAFKARKHDIVSEVVSEYKLRDLLDQNVVTNVVRQKYKKIDIKLWLPINIHATPELLRESYHNYCITKHEFVLYYRMMLGLPISDSIIDDIVKNMPDLGAMEPSPSPTKKRKTGDGSISDQAWVNTEVGYELNEESV